MWLKKKKQMIVQTQELVSSAKFLGKRLVYKHQLYFYIRAIDALKKI